MSLLLLILVVVLLFGGPVAGPRLNWGVPHYSGWAIVLAILLFLLVTGQFR